MEFRTQLTPKSFKKAAIQNADINHLRAKMTYMYMGIFFILFVGVSVYVLAGSKALGFIDGWAVVLTINFVAAVIFGLLLGYIKIEQSFRSAIKVGKTNGSFDENIMTLDDDGITRKFSDGSISHIDKSRITDVYETNEFFIVKLGKYTVLALEKDKLSLDSVSGLRDSLSSYIDHEILVKNI